MIAIIFEVTPKPDKKADYLDLAAEMRPIIEKVEGFISVERVQSLTNPEKLLPISLFEDEAAVDRWRKLATHRKVQSKGRREIFDDYSSKVLQVLRNYGMTDREEAPKDSLKVHV